MTSLTIRNLGSDTKEALRRRAAAHGRSMQDEARLILVSALDSARAPSARSLYSLIRATVEPLGGIDIELPPRDVTREPPSFD